MKEEVVIVGGGLAGLTAAYRLKKAGFDPLILESSDRLGGRIYTKSKDGYSFELGATWVFEDPLLKQLIEELGLNIYPQYLTGDALIKYAPNMGIQRSPTDALMNGAIYHKIEGGTIAIIGALANKIDANRILLNKKVTSIEYQNEEMKVMTDHGSVINATRVILAIPPKVVADQIVIKPAIMDNQIMRSAHTWMGDSTKFTVLFDRDHWRIKNLSGFVYSNYGLIREMQDHTTNESFGLLGFLQPIGELAVSFEKRKALVIHELKEILGIDEQHIVGYEDFLWGEYFTDRNHLNYNAGLVPHQNNGHDFFLDPFFDHRLFLAGAETSPTNPGYMEGAVRSAYRAARLLSTYAK